MAKKDCAPDSSTSSLKYSSCAGSYNASPCLKKGSFDEVRGVGESTASAGDRGSACPPACSPTLSARERCILDMPTPDCGQSFLPSLRRFTLSLRSRRVFSRALMGVKKSGRYYFITFTSSPQSPKIEQSWLSLRKWLQRQRSQSSHFHVITSEGHGVIHMILRLGKKEKRIEVKVLRAYWQNLHRAKQIKIIRISRREDMARYIADQRQKKSLAGEFAWQHGITSWGWSKGWLPRGFTSYFGRFWWRSRDADMGQREMFLHDWLLRCYEDDTQVKAPPSVVRG